MLGVFDLSLCFILYIINCQGLSFLHGEDGQLRITIDAGSTGSRIYVFEYVNTGRIPLVTFTGKDAPSLKTKPGLSAFASRPEKAGDSLLELLNFATQKVPESHRSGTKIHLMATAGLRRLDSNIQERIMESYRRVLRFSGFRFRDDWASISYTGKKQ